MKALTLTQPWATLVAIGAKRIETRSWSTKYRGPLAIHAAKGFPRDARDMMRHPSFCKVLHPRGFTSADHLPLGVVLAICELYDCRGTWSINYADLDPAEYDFGNYAEGRFAFFLRNVVELEPVSIKGALGLWEIAGEWTGP